jgi:hypothetical protein
MDLDLPAWEDLELPMCDYCHVRMKALDLRVGVADEGYDAYGIALLECPSCLIQEQRQVALVENALLGAGRRIDHRRKTIEEVRFMMVIEPEESDRPHRPVHRASPPKELVLRAV